MPKPGMLRRESREMYSVLLETRILFHRLRLQGLLACSELNHGRDREMEARPRPSGCGRGRAGSTLFLCATGGLGSWTGQSLIPSHTVVEVSSPYP